MTRRLLPLLCVVALACARSGGNEATASSTEPGAVSVHVKAFRFEFEVTAIRVEIQPVNLVLALAYDANAGSFTGSVQLPAGNQTFTARAYVGETLVGVSQPATILIQAGQESLVDLVILDTTGPAPTPDHGPIITLFTVSNSSPLVGDAVTLEAGAVDIDPGDSVSYEWTQSCSGVFTAPTSAQTDWSSGQAGQCMLTVTASSNGLLDSRSVVLTVRSNLGSARIGGFYVSQPRVNSINLSNPANPSNWCAGNRLGTNATCLYGDLPAVMLVGQSYRLAVDFWLGPHVQEPGSSLQVLNDCGGVVGNPSVSEDFGPGNPTYSFDFEAPGTTTVCSLRAVATNYGLVDEFTTALSFVAPSCTEDAYELNNDPVHAARYTLGTAGPQTAYSAIYTNDEEWFEIDNFTLTGLTSIAVQTEPPTPLPMQAYSLADLVTPIASGTGSVSIGGVTDNTVYYIRVVPEPGAGGCATTSYSLRITAQ